MNDKKMDIMVTNGYGAKTKQAFVTIVVHPHDWSIQLSSKDARALAFNIIGAAEAADNDAFFIEYMLGQVGLKEGQVVILLEEYREWRENK